MIVFVVGALKDNKVSSFWNIIVNALFWAVLVSPAFFIVKQSLLIQVLVALGIVLGIVLYFAVIEWHEVVRASNLGDVYVPALGIVFAWLFSRFFKAAIQIWHRSRSKIGKI